MKDELNRYRDKRKAKDKLDNGTKSVIRKIFRAPYQLYIAIEGKLRPILRNKWLDFVFSHKERYKTKALAELIYYVEDVEIPRQLNLSGNSMELFIVTEYVELANSCIGLEQFVSTEDYGRYGYKDNRYAKLLAQAYKHKGKQLKYIWFLNQLEMYFDDLGLLVDKGSVENIYGSKSEYIRLSLPVCEEG